VAKLDGLALLSFVLSKFREFSLEVLLLLPRADRCLAASSRPLLPFKPGSSLLLKRIIELLLLLPRVDGFLDTS
jgi:hypothetical protein